MIIVIILCTFLGLWNIKITKENKELKKQLKNVKLQIELHNLNSKYEKELENKCYL